MQNSKLIAQGVRGLLYPYVSFKDEIKMRMASIRDHRVNDNMDPFLFQVIVWKRISSILVRNNLWETLAKSWKRINVRGSTCPSSQNKSLISQIILMKTLFRL
jgi:hypothetical protein